MKTLLMLVSLMTLGACNSKHDLCVNTCVQEMGAHFLGMIPKTVLEDHCSKECSLYRDDIDAARSGKR